MFFPACFRVSVVILFAAAPLFAADGLDSLSDDSLLEELARRNQSVLLERAFETNHTPEETRNGIRAVAALARLKSDGSKMTDEARRAAVAKVVAGITAILPQITDPHRAAEQADALIAAGVSRDVNTLEYWGPSVTAQAQLRPTVETVIKLLDKADTLAQEKSAKLGETANPNVPADMKRVEEMEQLGLVAQQGKALAGYYLALCYDPSDANRAKIAGESIDYLSGYDADGNPARENLKLVLGKLHATRGEFDKARADLDFVANSTTSSDDAKTQTLRQFEARYFRAVVEVQAKQAAAARAKYAELMSWEQANPSDDPAIATANALLDYRIAAIEPGQTERATKLLIDLLARRPDLEAPIMAQLRAGISNESAVATLAPLQLRSLVIDAQEQVVRAQQDATFKPDRNSITRGLDAANELVSRTGRPGVDARVAADAEFLAGAFLETLDRKAEAASRYLDFAEAHKANVDSANAALSNAQRLFAQLGGLKSEDENVTKLYDRILPLSLSEPFNQKQLAYDWAYRLQETGHPADAATWFRRVEKSDPRFAASRYYLMVALSQSLDGLKTGDAERPALAKEIQSLADEVRTAAATPAADERGRLAQRQRLARTSLLAASIARTEQNDPRRALQLLNDVAPSIEGLPDADALLGEAMFTRIQSNMQLGETDAAVTELVQLLDRSGGARGAQVVFNMLSKLERDFGAAQAAGDRAKMAQLQANRAALTPYLVKWAEKNTSADVRKFTYRYRVYDAETQRLAADFLDDEAARTKKRGEALALFEALDSAEGRGQYIASRGPAAPASFAYDPQVALGIARVKYDAQDWPAARDAYARLLSDRAVGTAIATVREAGSEKQVDNDAYWEATLRLIDTKVKAGDDVEPLKVLLREQVIRWGDRVGGKQWMALAKTLRDTLIPDFTPDAR